MVPYIIWYIYNHTTTSTDHFLLKNFKIILPNELGKKHLTPVWPQIFPPFLSLSLSLRASRWWHHTAWRSSRFSHATPIRARKVHLSEHEHHKPNTHSEKCLLGESESQNLRCPTRHGQTYSNLLQSEDERSTAQKGSSKHFRKRSFICRSWCLLFSVVRQGHRANITNK